MRWQGHGRCRRALCCCLLAGLWLATGVQAASRLAVEGVAHYTLALSWQAGFCQTQRRPPRECREPARQQGNAPGFVLHGLWPSLPERFAEAGVTRRRWWSKGCFLERPRADGGFCRAHAPLAFEETLDSALDSAMPGRTSCLDRYEYAKHAACLGLPAEAYFTTALALLKAVNASAFGDFLRNHQGDLVERNDLIGAFEAAFGEGTGRALSLQCRGRGKRVLTEVRIGIDAQRLEAFPAVDSLVPMRRGRCAPRIDLVAP